MRWLKRFFHVPEFRLRVDGEPVGEYTADVLMGMAGIFTNTPGLQQAWTSQFNDTMDALEKLPADSHGERIRLAERACGMWRALRIPQASIAQANALIEAQRIERTQYEKTQVPQGQQNVM